MGESSADRREVEEAGEGERSSVLAGGDAAELLELSKHALNGIAVTVAPEIAGDWLATIGAGRNDQQDTLHQRALANSIAIITLVSEQGLGLQILDVGLVAALSHISKSAPELNRTLFLHSNSAQSWGLQKPGSLWAVLNVLHVAAIA